MAPSHNSKSGDRIDAASMQTELGLTAARRLNVAYEQIEGRVHRLAEVLKEFLLFESETQLTLSSGAIVWALASLARHKNRARCEHWFYAVVDGVYIDTDDAEQGLSDVEKHVLETAAAAIRQDLAEDVRITLSESMAAFRLMKEDAVPRILAEAIFPVLNQYLEHTSEETLRLLILHATNICSALQRRDLGIGTDDEFAGAADALLEVGFGAQRAVVNALENGQLLMIDGEIVDPTRIENDEDEADA